MVSRAPMKRAAVEADVAGMGNLPRVSVSREGDRVLVIAREKKKDEEEEKWESIGDCDCDGKDEEDVYDKVGR